MKIAKQFDVSNNIQSLVSVLREVHTALRNNLTLGDNVIGAFPQINVATAATYTGGTFQPIVLPWAYADKKSPQSVIVAQVINPSNQQDRLLSSVTCQNWTYDSVKQVINISYIAGLNNSSKYTITFEVK